MMNDKAGAKPQQVGLESIKRVPLTRWAALLPLLLVLLAIGGLIYTPVVYQSFWQQYHDQQGLTGNWSDLYARWYGTREVLLHGRDPYSSEIITEMQRGFFGRDQLPGETLPEVAVFAMPLYTVFLLAPLALFDFATVETITSILLPLFVVIGALLWQAARGGAVAGARYVIAGLLALAWPATTMTGYLQQLTGMVFLFLTGAVFLVARGRLGWAGLLLALSTIKFQEGWLLIALLLLWSVSKWNERRALALSFGGTVLLLSLAAALLQPDWVLQFAGSLVRYTDDTAGWRKFTALLPMPVLIAFAAATAGAFVVTAWRVRLMSGESLDMLRASAAALAAALVLLPTHQTYEGTLILPALIILLMLAPAQGVAKILHIAATELMLAPYIIAAIYGWLELLGLPMHDAPETLRAIPLIFYLILPHIAFLALTLQQSTSSNSGYATT